MSVTATSADRPTVVLVHGAFAESSSWNGGIVISNAGTGNDHLRALVFIGAFAPAAGQRATDLSGRYQGSTLGATLAAVPLPDGGSDPHIRQDRYPAQFAADASPGEAAVLAVTQRPLTEASGEPAWKTVPSWFLFGTEDRNIPGAAHRVLAERAGSRRTVELRGGSHAVAIAEAAAVVDLSCEAASGAAVRWSGLEE
jgi:pimeloyl-ACP methyl ester carboxylesterase